MTKMLSGILGLRLCLLQGYQRDIFIPGDVFEEDIEISTAQKVWPQPNSYRTLIGQLNCADSR